MTPEASAQNPLPAEGGEETRYYLATTELTGDEYRAHTERAEAAPNRMPPTLLQESGYTGSGREQIHEDLIPHIIRDAAIASGMHWPEGLEPQRLDPEECNTRDWPLELKADVMNRSWSNWRPGKPGKGQSTTWTTGRETAREMLTEVPDLALLFTAGPEACAVHWESRRRGAAPEENAKTRFTSHVIDRTLRGELIWKDAGKGALTASGGLQGIITVAPAGASAVATAGARNISTVEITAHGIQAETLLTEAGTSSRWRIGQQHQIAAEMRMTLGRTQPPKENMEAVAIALLESTQKGSLAWRCAEYQDSALLSVRGGFAHHTLQWPKGPDGEGRVVLRTEQDGRTVGELEGNEGRPRELLRDLWYAALENTA